MSRIMIASVFTVAAVCVSNGVSNTAEAQPGHRHGHAPQPVKLHYNPPSRYVQAPVPVPMTSRHAHGFIDCSPTLGFYGEITRQGMLVTRVQRGTEASRIGLQPGDVILRVNNQQIRTPHDWECALEQARREVCLTVRRTCGNVAELHARLSHNHRSVSSIPQPRYQVPPVYSYPVPVAPQTGYNISFGDRGFHIGLSIQN